jgi:hypothetical protein
VYDNIDEALGELEGDENVLGPPLNVGEALPELDAVGEDDTLGEALLLGNRVEDDEAVGEALRVGASVPDGVAEAVEEGEVDGAGLELPVALREAELVSVTLLLPVALLDADVVGSGLVVPVALLEYTAADTVADIENGVGEGEALADGVEILPARTPISFAERRRVYARTSSMAPSHVYPKMARPR